ncbi:MAG: hypothetical protein D4R97_00470 [Bacteroidetes bacterium]|nr:MAG: hypothetical protein D4R97_00470 [Bacteroidota bacterium]
MRYVLPLFLLLFSGLGLVGQNQGAALEGSVTYVTSQSVYVKFNNTAKIKAGDTLFIQQGETLVPALKVKDLSSTSCVCTPLSATTFKVSDKVFFKPAQGSATNKEESAPTVTANPQEPINQTVPVEKPDSTGAGKPLEYKKKQQIHGFVNVASNSNLSNYSATISQSEKLTFSLSARNIGNSNLSAEYYISGILNDKQYNETSKSIFNKVKIYNLAISYDFGKTATLLIGRKINPKLSNMGSNDGLQFELKFKPLSIGIIAGYRPNFTDYGFNSNLFQYGTYLYNEYAGKKGFMQTSLAVINQTNSGKTDRRFFYVQHVNSLVKNLTFFGSAEVDIFGKEFNSLDSTYKTKSTPKLTNLYLSLSYRILRRLSISLSYSARQNVIYYETYKTYLDRLLDNQTTQGYSLQVNYSPVNKLSIGATASYRFSKPDPKPTQNLYAYLTYSQIPGINTSVTVSTILLRTGYLNGRIYSVGLSKDLASGKLYMGLTYRYVDYHYYNTEYLPTYQNMGEFSLTWRIVRKLLFSVYYEGTFEKINQFHRLYAQINLGF